MRRDLLPAIITQAAATAAVQFDGRFVLGVGSGEAGYDEIYVSQIGGHAEEFFRAREQDVLPALR